MKSASQSCWKIPGRKELCGHAWNLSVLYGLAGGPVSEGTLVERMRGADVSTKSVNE